MVDVSQAGFAAPIHKPFSPTMLPDFVYKSVFDNSPIGSYLLSPTPDAIILDVNGSFLKSVFRTREDLIGKSIFDVFPANPADSEDTGIQALRHSIVQVITTGKPHALPAQRYPVPVTLPNGQQAFEEKFWNASNTPIFGPDGSLAYISHATMDVTQAIQAEKEMRRSEERFRTLVTATSFITWVADPDGRIRTDPPSWRAFTGQSFEDGCGDDWLAALHPDDRAFTAALWKSCVRKKKIYEAEYRIRRRDGTYRWTAVRAIPIVEADGSVREWIGTNTDIDEQKRAREALQVANKRLTLAIEGTGEGVWEWDMRRNRTTYSERFKEIVGCADQELSGDPNDWFSLIHPDDREHAYAAMRAHLGGKTASYSCEYRIRCSDGSWKWMHSRGIVVEKSSSGEPLRVAGMISDITLRKESEERIWHIANFDSLTSLPNRRLFRERLHQDVLNAQHKQRTVALLFIDLDRFKQVNDLLGHDAGDVLLLQAAQRIKQCVRDTDTVSRLGGDEFTVTFSDLSSTDHVEYFAQKILDALAYPFCIGNEKAYLSGSIGIAVYPDDANTPEELIRKADQAMYAAKQSGKNQFSYFTKEMDEQAHMRLRLIQELRNAVQDGQINVYYQPVVELQSGSIFKAEALVRWRHPLFGNVDPSLFIPLAEEAGLINTLGDYVFREAASNAKYWGTALGMPLQISVNKSPIQFGSKEQDKWLSYLRQLDLSPGCITVEITEGVLLDVSDNVSEQLFEYRDAGIQVAIDDFGTGYSSLAYLQKFDIDYLKIDQSFIKGIANNHENRAIAESIIVMAHKLGLKVVAEGIETADQLAVLKEAGCDYGQGFFFSQPLAANEFETMLLQEKRTRQMHFIH